MPDSAGRFKFKFQVERAGSESSPPSVAQVASAASSGVSAASDSFLESSFQDPCPTLNGTRRATMPKVLTRRSEPITLLAKRGRLHLQTPKLALVVITQKAEARQACDSEPGPALVPYRRPRAGAQVVAPELPLARGLSGRRGFGPRMGVLSVRTVLTVPWLQEPRSVLYTGSISPRRNSRLG
jgi:hypothetical protein